MVVSPFVSAAGFPSPAAFVVVIGDLLEVIAEASAGGFYGLLNLPEFHSVSFTGEPVKGVPYVIGKGFRVNLHRYVNDVAHGNFNLPPCGFQLLRIRQGVQFHVILLSPGLAARVGVWWCVFHLHPYYNAYIVQCQ
jgi:hypothetical protein